MEDFKEVKAGVKELNVKVDKLTEISVKNSVELAHHIKRTDLNETRIEKLEYWLLGLLGAILVAAAIRGIF